MARCLCCDKEMKDPVEYESEIGWHRKCIKSFFGTDTLPELDISDRELERLADLSVNKGLTVTGVQKKLSLHLDNEDRSVRLTVVDFPAGYILKPGSEDYEALPEAEYLTMKMAEIAGIRVVENALIRTKNQYAYITKRIDRAGEKKLAMEDFCQLSGRSSSDKYRSSYENCGKLIKRYSKNTGIDMAEFFYRLLFCFVTGNSDMHLKNFSLIESYPKSRIFGLSPAYDLLPVNIIIPDDVEQTALSLNGKKRNIRKKDFMMLADNIGIKSNAADKMIIRITGLGDAFIREVKGSYIPDHMKKEMINLIRSRITTLRSEAVKEM